MLEEFMFLNWSARQVMLAPPWELKMMNPQHQDD